MTTEAIIANTKQMIDDLKTVCANFGLGNASSEYKIITEIFLYKFLNDKFIYEVQQADEEQKNSENVEQALNNMSEDDYEMLMMLLPPATAKLKREHFISYLFNHKNDEKFNELFDSTLWDISNTNLDVFSVSTGSGDKIRLFDQNLSQNVTESNRRSDFCKAMIDKLVTFSFAEAFSQKYDFFATIFEYLIKDYNKDFGKYAEYYTPHSIASIIAKDDFSVVVDYDKIEQKKYSFSAGQYFKVKIEYVELTQEEFQKKMDGYTEKLTELFAEGNALQTEILVQLKKVKYE